MILLHAFPLDGSMWGDLGTPIDYPGDGSLADWADLVASRLERPAVVGGLSMGGYAAFELWRRHPASVAGLLLADTRAEADGVEQRDARDRSAELVRRRGSAELFDQMAPRLFAPHPDPAVVAQARAIAARQPTQRMVAMLEALRDRADSTDLLGTITVPTVVVCGSHDAITPAAQGRAMAERIAGARFVEIPGAGHLSALEQPALFAAAMPAG